MGIEVKLEGQDRLDPEFDALLKQAQSTLESIVSRSSISIDAIWLVHKHDKGQDRVGLVLADTVENLHVSTDFSLDELKDADRLNRRLREVWGDLLQSRLEAIGKRLRSILSEEGVAL